MELPSSSLPGELRCFERLKQKQIYDKNEFVNFSLMSLIQSSLDEPSSIKEAFQHDCRKRAMNTELDAIEQNYTLNLVLRPQQRKIVLIKWIYKTKYKVDGSLDKHKARLVARGFTLCLDVEFDETSDICSYRSYNDDTHSLCFGSPSLLAYLSDKSQKCVSQ